MPMETSSSIDMESEVKRELRLRVKGCTTEEQVQQVVEAMPQDQKMKYVYTLATEEMFEEIKLKSLEFIDYCEHTGCVNDLERGVGRQESLVGVILVATKMLQQQAEAQARHEMQCLSEETQWGMQIADSISDHSVAISSAADQLSTLSSHYAAVLKGRRMGWHFTNEEGAGVPIDGEDTEQLRLDLEGT